MQAQAPQTAVMPAQPHGARLRTGRHSIPNGIYLVTTVTIGRHPLFLSLTAGRCLVLTLREAEHQGLARTLAYVVMPDHLHWLCRLGERDELSKVVNWVKGASSRRIGRGGVWQRGFHDRALRQEDDLPATARYVVANPLRAGLVRSLRDYPLWDAAWV